MAFAVTASQNGSFTSVMEQSIATVHETIPAQGLTVHPWPFHRSQVAGTRFVWKTGQHS